MKNYMRIAAAAAFFLSSAQIANAASTACNFIAAPFAQTGSITTGVGAFAAVFPLPGQNFETGDHLQITFTNNSGGNLNRGAGAGAGMEMSGAGGTTAYVTTNPLADGASETVDVVVAANGVTAAVFSTYGGTIDFEITCLNGVSGGGGPGPGSSGLDSYISDPDVLAQLNQYFDGMSTAEVSAALAELSANTGIDMATVSTQTIGRG